jgi:hypothetical protein
MWRRVESWLRARLAPPEPGGPPRLVRAFDATAEPICRGSVTAEEGAWRIEARGPQTCRLYEVGNPGVEQCLLGYRARLRSENVQARAYLEMWCWFATRGEFFSKGFHAAVTGTNDWASYEIPFFLKQGQRPDLVKLNVVFEGPGTLWVKDVALWATPLR